MLMFPLTPECAPRPLGHPVTIRCLGRIDAMGIANLASQSALGEWQPVLTLCAPPNFLG